MKLTRDQAITYYLGLLIGDQCETVVIDGEILILERDTRASLNPFENSKMAVNLDTINIDRELRILGLDNKERDENGEPRS